MIKSDSYSKIYHQLLKDVYNNPEFEVFGDFKECLNVSFTLSNIMNNEVINHYKAPNYKYAKEYFKHIISGKTNIDKLATINPIVLKFVDSTGLPPNFTSQYGPRIKHQLPRVIKLLKDESYLTEVLTQGTKNAELIAKNNLDEIYKIIGLRKFT